MSINKYSGKQYVLTFKKKMCLDTSCCKSPQNPQNIEGNQYPEQILNQWWSWAGGFSGDLALLPVLAVGCFHHLFIN